MRSWHLDLIDADEYRCRDHQPVNNRASALELGGIAKNNIASDHAPVDGGQHERRPCAKGRRIQLEYAQARSDDQGDDVHDFLILAFRLFHFAPHILCHFHPQTQGNGGSVLQALPYARGAELGLMPRLRGYSLLTGSDRLLDNNVPRRDEAARRTGRRSRR